MDDDGEKGRDRPSLNAELGRRIRYATEKLAPGNAERFTGKSYRTLERYFAGHDVPVSVVLGLSKGTGLSVDWILTGKSSASEEEKPSGLVAVPVLPEAISAGDGLLADENDNGSADHLMFSKGILRTIVRNAQNAALLSVRGDSMEPTLSSGDWIMADTSDRDISTAGIFVIGIDGATMVKRLMRRSDGSVMVISDNQALYPPEIITAAEADSFRVIGRVKWHARTLR